MEFQHAQISLRAYNSMSKLTKINTYLPSTTKQHSHFRLNLLSIHSEFVIPTRHGERPLVDLGQYGVRHAVNVNTSQC